MRTRTALLTLLALLAGALTLSSATSADAVADRDCSDFVSQRQAQIFFLKQGGPELDPHRLDADGDGVVCESNPCPCYRGTRLPSGAETTQGPKRLRQAARITKVSDGDTVNVKLIGGPKARVRLVGIDTPEVYGTVECGGPAASRALKRVLPVGTRVMLVSDRTQDRKDRYGRLLRYVMKAGHDMNRRQVLAGRARVYVYQHHPFERTKSYRAAQAKAKAAGRGLWGTC